MTSQIQEILIYNGKSVGMASEPLESYLKLTNQTEIFVAPISALWRGYVGRWLIEDSKLYLVELNGHIKEYKPVAINFLFSNQDKVFAEWFTGAIRVPQGEMLNYVHSGYDSKYERDLYLDLIKGRVVNSRLAENTPTEDEDNVCVFEDN